MKRPILDADVSTLLTEAVKRKGRNSRGWIGTSIGQCAEEGDGSKKSKSVLIVQLNLNILKINEELDCCGLTGKYFEGEKVGCGILEFHLQ